ncbi:MAG: [Clostridia bacterium]|nr:[citrate (pro-3S)-lyase] ligase [Clostridia bacterium]
MSFIVSEAAGLYGPQLEKTAEFLSKMGLRYEGGAEYTVFLVDEEGEILGTGSLCGSVLKYIAVDDALQGEGGAAAIVSRLVQHAYLLGRRKLFLFTKPQNEYLFRSLGFFTLASTNSSCYMENSRRGLRNYLDSLQKGSGVQGAVVANCNPFTLGHQYLMETAAAMVDTLHVFVVSEDSSEFPFAARFELVKKGTAHIKNLILHESGDYIISHSTFPTYFIKSTADAESVNAELDLALFGERIAPALGITKRFVGTEPFCAVTNAYNEKMKELLPKYGVEVIEIERKDGISASKVRAAMEAGDLGTVRSLVPDATFDYIMDTIGGDYRCDDNLPEDGREYNGPAEDEMPAEAAERSDPEWS